MQFLAGVDEVGRGCLAGPVISSAVILDQDNPILGLRDSKLLSEKKREELFSIIKSMSLDHTIGSASHIEIDKVNILNATMLSMKRAIEKLKYGCVKVYVDGNQCPEIDKKLQIKIESKIGGDKIYPCISAASIIAKVTRDRYMREMHLIYPHYGFNRNKGYPTKEHLDAILTHGPTPIHRLTFKPELYD